MNRETSTYFSELPEVHIQRSKIEKPHGLKTSWSVGDCVPIYVDEILAGSTVKMDMAAVMRMSTPLYPTMDTLMTDFLWFFVPYRLVWDHWVNMWGENTNAWYPQVTYEVPQIMTTTNYTFQPKSVADYMGLPTGVEGIEVSSLPFRCYVKIWNDWFRSDPLQQEAPNVTNDTDIYTGTDAYKGGTLLKANKLHDMFTSALPNAQRGPDVQLPIGYVAPVITEQQDNTYPYQNIFPLRFLSADGYEPGGPHALYISKNNGKYDTMMDNAQYSPATNSHPVWPSNLVADLTSATAATVSELRSALAVQHFYEQMARFGGGRYTEFLRAIFGVVSPDARLQRSEFLGGKRVPHQVATVVQTSSTDSTSPQGNTAAYSHTTDSDSYFTKSFTEPGALICIMVTRYKHTYQQGIPKMFSHKKWTDFYLPQFNGISEVPILNKEIYAQGTTVDNQVFGYQEYGYEYRYFQDICTSEMKSTYSQSLDAWHYGDDYSSLPILGSSWIQEDKANVDRTLAVSSGLADQLIGDFYFTPTYTLPMPIYSLPGMSKL